MGTCYPLCTASSLAVGTQGSVGPRGHDSCVTEALTVQVGKIAHLCAWPLQSSPPLGPPSK